jgi:hypothetical protein
MGTDSKFYSRNRVLEIYKSMDEFAKDKSCYYGLDDTIYKATEEDEKYFSCFFGREYLLNTGFIEDWCNSLKLSDEIWGLFMMVNYHVDHILDVKPEDFKYLNKKTPLTMLKDIKKYMEVNKLIKLEDIEKYEEENEDPYSFPCYYSVIECIEFMEELEDNDHIFILSF